VFYFVWISFLISSIFILAWLSCKSNSSWPWFWTLLIGGGLFQMWPWVARFTKRIVFDAILYDSIAVIAWTCALLFWSGTRFSVAQYVGAFIVLIGLILVQRG